MAYGGSSYGGGSGLDAPATPVVPPTTQDYSGVATRSQQVGAGGVVVGPSNDDYVAALVLTGTSGSISYTVENATVEPGEPYARAGTVWFLWTPNYTGVGALVDFSPVNNCVLECFIDGGSVDAVAPAGIASGFDVRVGETYAIRAYNYISPFDSSTHTLTWSVSVRALDFTLASDTIPWAPGSVTTYIANDSPGSTVSFAIDGVSNGQTVTTDSEGGATFALTLPTLSVGFHVVIATSSSGREGVGSFMIQDSGTFTPPTPPTPPPVEVSTTTRWRLQDPVTDETWDFPVNPLTEGSTVLPRNLSGYWTTAISDGQPIVFEGRRRARSWELTGYLLTLDDLNKLRSWQRPYRVYITDDLKRTFVVKIRRVASQPVANSSDLTYPEAHTYTLSTLLFGAAPS